MDGKAHSQVEFVGMYERAPKSDSLVQTSLLAVAKHAEPNNTQYWPRNSTKIF